MFGERIAGSAGAGRLPRPQGAGILRSDAMKHTLDCTLNRTLNRTLTKSFRTAAAWLSATAIAVAFAPGAAAQDGTAATSGSSTPAASAVNSPATPAAPVAIGGMLHGMVKSGNIALPGVTVTAANTLTGKRYITTTDIRGAWSMTIPQNGRYVVRTQFAAFAPGSQEALLNATSRDQALNFDLMLASRLAAQQQLQGTQVTDAIRQLATNGLQSLSLTSAMSEGGETQAAGSGSGAAGASLPSIASNSDFGGESVAISGQSGTVSPMAGLDMDRIRDAIETARVQSGQGGNFTSGILTGGANGLFNGGGFGGPGGGFGGGPGGGFGGGGRMNFRNFNPSQPHGAIFWTGSNSALNAEPYALRGQEQEQPASGTNRFGLTLMGAPYIPKLTKPSGKDTVFLTLSGQRSSSPSDLYATVPTEAEREGEIPGLATKITPTPEAANLLKYFPLPNLPGTTQNYHLLTTAQNNNTLAGVRYMRGIGSNASPFGAFGGGRGGGGRRSQTQGLRQSINFNYNWSHAAQDNINVFPQLGGKGSTDSNSVQAGYTLGYHKITSIFNASWNRSNSSTTNFFTNGIDVATGNGILGPDGNPLNASPLNYGLPNISLSQFTGLSEQQPSLFVSQTISLSETMSWIRGKHNLRFGGDYRRVHRDFLGAGATGSTYNGTGTFYFTGLYTGSALGDFLLGEPQETSIDAAAQKAYLRDNVYDAFANDDWRVLPNLTLNYGVRYELYQPYTEKYGHLAFVDTNPEDEFTHAAGVVSGQNGPFSGQLPSSLVYPYETAFAPRVGIALRLPKSTVVRAGFGMNYSVGQYAVFATEMAHEPPFANEQINEVTTLCPTRTVDCLSLSNGFPSPATVGNYAVDPHYHLPYVQVWNLDVQKTLPWNVVLNVGYNGSKGNHLDVTTAPGRNPLTGASYSGVDFNYEQSVAFSKFSASTLRVNKRLSNGLAMGANYQYSHSIDDAGSVGGTSTMVAQNWQNLQAEQENSSFDIRHKVSGTYLYELPFGQDKHWLTTGTPSRIFEGFSVSGSFNFATGAPLTPVYQAAALDVARGTAGSLRPDRVPGASLTAGGGTLTRWFNTAAFTAPTGPYGTASRNSIPGPGTISNNMSLSKTMQLGETRSFEIRATINNVFNTVQYSGVNTTLYSGADTNIAQPFGQVDSVAAMRQFNFLARFRF
jgi:trimeric autotransporter adhesin